MVITTGECEYCNGSGFAYGRYIECSYCYEGNKITPLLVAKLNDIFVKNELKKILNRGIVVQK